MPAAGGLKLALQAATRDDRRLRFAQVKLRTPGIEDALCLVTDARGRMRYRLPDGEYRIPHGECALMPLGARGDLTRVAPELTAPSRTGLAASARS
jgi:hypothetical protein